jgi:uncharacterized protein (TIGR00255 family)
MICSMTAFAHHETKDDQGHISWQLRSVNHRFLDISMRLPEQFRSLESQLRERLTKRLSRGKLDCSLHHKPPANFVDRVIVNETLAKELIDASHKLEISMNNAARISPIEILQWPGVALEPETDTAPLLNSALRAFDEALDGLIENRNREGARLKSLLTQRRQSIVEIVEKVRERRPQILDAQRQKLLTRLSELDVQADPQRLEQELVLLTQKLDVEEELDRLLGHCTELNDVLERGEPIGRRMDFLMQEFNREANTLASKSADLQTTQAAVELKVLIEQMREQVQNIE